MGSSHLGASMLLPGILPKQLRRGLFPQLPTGVTLLSCGCSDKTPGGPAPFDPWRRAGVRQCSVS